MTLANYEAYSKFHEDLNKILHAMASHLHRYASEISSLEETLTEVTAHHKRFTAKMADRHPPDGSDSPEKQNSSHKSDTSHNQRIQDGLQQVALQLSPIKHFEQEIEKKLETIMALVNSIPLSSTSLAVATGQQTNNA